MHVVVLVRSNPVVVGHGVVVQINEQLLQRGVLFGQRIGSRQIVAAVGIGEKDLGIVLGGVVELGGAVERIDSAIAEDA